MPNPNEREQLEQLIEDVLREAHHHGELKNRNGCLVPLRDKLADAWLADREQARLDGAQRENELWTRVIVGLRAANDRGEQNTTLEVTLREIERLYLYERTKSATLKGEQDA